MIENRNRINIMSSCNNNLTKFIFVQLKTMAIHLKNKEVHFYLFYHRIPKEMLDKLELYCEYLGNITFHRVYIEHIAGYEEVAANMNYDKDKYNWPYEAYFSLECHRHLPLEVDRILYIDAGDVLFVDEIDEYYFDDFHDKSLIVRPIVVKKDLSYFTLNDLADEEHSKFIKHGIFNSGSYIINVDKFRVTNTPMSGYIELSLMLEGKSRTGFRYNGDQGFLSLAFINRMKYFKFDEIKDVAYQQYNFTPALATHFRKNKETNGGLWYDPKIIHLVGAPTKPWNLISILIQEGVVKKGEKVDINEILKKASQMKQIDFKHTNVAEPDEYLIDEGMIPMFEYWFNINNMVEIDFEKIFKDF